LRPKIQDEWISSEGAGARLTGPRRSEGRAPQGGDRGRSRAVLLRKGWSGWVRLARGGAKQTSHCRPFERAQGKDPSLEISKANNIRRCGGHPRTRCPRVDWNRKAQETPAATGCEPHRKSQGASTGRKKAQETPAATGCEPHRKRQGAPTGRKRDRERSSTITQESQGKEPEGRGTESAAAL
jgi:hypothetical protein